MQLVLVNEVELNERAEKKRLLTSSRRDIVWTALEIDQGGKSKFEVSYAEIERGLQHFSGNEEWAVKFRENIGIKEPR